MEALKLSMQAVSEATNESMPTIYKAIQLGHLETFLVGRRRFARPDAVRKWVDYLEAQSQKGRPVVYRDRETEETQRQARRAAA